MSDTPREPHGDARRLLVEKAMAEGEAMLELHKTPHGGSCEGRCYACDVVRGLLAALSLKAPKLPCTCGPPSFPYQEHDGDCPRGLAEAVPSPAFEDDDPSQVPEGTGDTWGPPLRRPVLPSCGHLKRGAVQDHRCSKEAGHAGAHTDGSASWHAAAVPSAPAGLRARAEALLAKITPGEWENRTNNQYYPDIPAHVLSKDIDEQGRRRTRFIANCEGHQRLRQLQEQR